MITLINVAIVHWQLLCLLEMMVDVVVVSSKVAGLAVMLMVEIILMTLSVVADGLRSSGTEVVELEESVAGPGMWVVYVYKRKSDIKMHIQATVHTINNAIHIIVIS